MVLYKKEAIEFYNSFELGNYMSIYDDSSKKFRKNIKIGSFLDLMNKFYKEGDVFNFKDEEELKNGKNIYCWLEENEEKVIIITLNENNQLDSLMLQFHNGNYEYFGNKKEIENHLNLLIKNTEMNLKEIDKKNKNTSKIISSGVVVFLPLLVFGYLKNKKKKND